MTTNGPVQTCSLDDYPSPQPPLPSPYSYPQPLEMFKFVHLDITIDGPLGWKAGCWPSTERLSCSTMP